MTKQVILIILLSVFSLFFRVELGHVLDVIVLIHNKIYQLLHMIFSDGPVGSIIQNLISLLMLPCIGGLLVGLTFWLVKRSAMPHIMAVVWVLWLVLLVTMVAQTSLSGRAVVSTVHHRPSDIPTL